MGRTLHQTGYPTRGRVTAALHELAELIKESRIGASEKDAALRHIENVKEELSDPKNADPGLIKKSLERLKTVLDAAKAGVDIYKKRRARSLPYSVS